MDFEFRILSFGSDEYSKTLRLREKILRAPLGLRLTAQELEKDIHDTHIGAFRKDRPDQLVACLVLTILGPKIMKMRQVAVLESMQSKGVGRALVAFTEKFIFERGFDEIELSARTTAVGFYLKLDYHVVGPRYFEIGIEHQKMIKNNNVP